MGRLRALLAGLDAADLPDLTRGDTGAIAA
jgi:hypothetical protein